MTSHFSAKEQKQDDFSKAVNKGLEDVKKGRTVSLKEARKRLSILSEDFMADRDDPPAQKRDLF